MFNVKFIAFALTLLSAVGFLNPRGMFSIQMTKVMFYAMSLLSLFIACMYGQKLKGIKYPRVAYWTILGSIILSAFMATAFHPQPLKVSIVVVLPQIFAFLFFFTLMKLDIPERTLLRFLLICCLVAVPVYFANVATFPNVMFGLPIDKAEDFSRGTLRVAIYFIEFMVMFVFYAINQWTLKHDWKWVAIGGLFMVMIFMSVIRQVIIFTTLLSLIFMLRQSSWTKRLIVIACAALAFMLILKIPIVQSMIEVSEDQSEDNEVRDEDIRIYDYRYFGNEGQTNDITRIFGNGTPSLGISEWGIQCDSEWETTGTYYVDVGWVGFYWLYGAIATLAILILFIKALGTPKPPDKKYLNYMICYIILVSIASGPLLFYHQIVEIAIVLYLIFHKNSDIENEENRINHPQLQQRRRLSDLHRQC